MRSVHQSDMPNTVRFLFSWIDSSLSIHSMGGVSDERRIGLMSGVKNGLTSSATTAGLESDEKNNCCRTGERSILALVIERGIPIHTATIRGEIQH